MTLSIKDLQEITGEYYAFKQSYVNAGKALADVISQGTTLYTDPRMLEQFTQQWSAYQAYLLSVKNKIDTFIAGLPVEPPLNS